MGKLSEPVLLHATRLLPVLLDSVVLVVVAVFYCNVLGAARFSLYMFSTPSPKHAPA